jgi:hypothetical protein
MTNTMSPTPIICKCGNQVGEGIIIDGVVLVHTGGGIWHELSGHCAQCSAPFYWSAKGMLIQRALISTKRRIPHKNGAGRRAPGGGGGKLNLYTPSALDRLGTSSRKFPRLKRIL